LRHELGFINESAKAIHKAGVGRPSIGIILGTGLGHLTRAIKNRVTVPFEQCPYFPKATAISHAGQLVYGTLHKKKVVAMQGRFHLFEGYSAQEITVPVRVMKALGVRTLILSNAAGGLNPAFSLGEVMVMTDHINFMGVSPLEGPNDDRLGERFPDMCEPYDSRLIEKAKTAAMDLGIRLQEGVYVSVRGPQLETKAEYRFMRNMGADAVGMSTVPEVICAVHAGMRVLAFSCITDMCLPDALEPVNIERILKTAEKSEPVLTRLVTQVVKNI
jgi:purine-nucleoside phosphorylase